MNRLGTERRAAVVRCLVEGNSIRATVRMTGAARNTVARLLVELGEACWEYQDRTLRGITSMRVQCGELWSFVGCREKNAAAEDRGTLGRGDVWTWTALDADTRLMICWNVATRDGRAACDLIAALKSKLANRVQLTTDGARVYLQATEDAFGMDVDYAMLAKVYGASPHGEKRCSPAECVSPEKVPTMRNPDPKHIPTSFVQRQNLTIRMGMGRCTRLTNAFSKKLENHAAAIALHFMYYNLARPHQTLSEPHPKTPAMAAGVTDHVWTVEEIVGLLGSN